MVELYDRLRAPRPEDEFSLPDGRRLVFADLFRNPYIDWPAHWPVNGQHASAVDERAIIAALTLRDPAAAPDDIHPIEFHLNWFTMGGHDVAPKTAHP